MGKWVLNKMDQYSRQNDNQKPENLWHSDTPSREYSDSQEYSDPYGQKEQSTKNKKGLWAALGALLLILSKFKFVFIFLITKLKYFLLIFIHEMGHFLTAKKIGLNVSTPLFIPFVGAFISMKEHPADAATEGQRWLPVAPYSGLSERFSVPLCIP